MVKRKSRSPRERARLFSLHGGICHMCGQKIRVGDRWELSHVIEWELTHDDSDENCKPAHYACHRTYTYTEGIRWWRRRSDWSASIWELKPHRNPSSPAVEIPTLRKPSMAEWCHETINHSHGGASV